MSTFSGRTVFITGATRGIGRAITETFLKGGGAKVYAAVRNPDSAAPLVEAYGDRVVPIPLDLAQPQTITAAAQKASDVDIVVSNAGVLKTAGPLDPGALDALNFEIEINVAGLLRMAQAFAPVLKANGGGAFVQLNSVASLLNFPDFATYSASKAAAYSITQGLRAKLGEQGTTVISVHPGPIATDMATDAGLTEMAEPPELVAESIIEALEKGEFHAFPDTMAKQIGGAYASFAADVIEAGLSEG